MGTFVPTTAAEREQMLRTIGVSSVEDLFRDVPQQMYLDGYLDLPPGRSELETLEAVSALAERNRVFKTCLRGAGSYRHYIPAAVKAVVTREEFVTAYTPYQAEISQGILQGIFEYQTMLCELTGMDVSNAGVYDGGTAAAEAIPMCRDRKRTKAYVSAAVDPNVLGVMKTYCFGSGTELTVVPMKDGRTDPDALRAILGADAACFYVQQPNFFGLLEDAELLGEDHARSRGQIHHGREPHFAGSFENARRVRRGHRRRRRSAPWPRHGLRRPVPRIYDRDERHDA